MNEPTQSTNMVIPKYRKLSFVSAAEMANMNIDPVSVIIPGYLTEGTFLLGCFSNGGKTWLALSLAKSVATGCSFLGITPRRTGKVLFIEMELAENTIKARIDKLNISDPNIIFVYSQDGKRETSSLPGRKDNLTDYLNAANEQVGGGIVLVVIDVWRNLKRPVPRGEDPDTVIYDQISELNAFCSQHHAAVMILHHTRKATKDFAFQETATDSFSGSNALVGAVKGGMWMLKGKQGEARSLYVELKSTTGSGEHAISFDQDTCTWVPDGSIEERERQAYIHNPVRNAILHLLGDNKSVWLTATHIAETIVELDGGGYTRCSAVDVGRTLNAIRLDAEKYDHIIIGDKTGKSEKRYPIERIQPTQPAFCEQTSVNM